MVDKAPELEDINAKTWRGPRLSWTFTLNEPTEIYIGGVRVARPTRIIEDGIILAVDWAGQWPLKEQYGIGNLDHLKGDAK